MAQFKFDWNNDSVEASSNSTGQVASYRVKASPAGAWLTDGFTPANTLPKTASTTTTKTLVNNTVYQFKVDNICTSGGPIANDNGIQEGIEFACLDPDVDEFTFSSATFRLTGLPQGTGGIAKAKIWLKLASNNTVVAGTPITVNAVAGVIETTVNGLDDNTNYYWEYEIYATVKGVSVKSSDANYIGQVCGAYPILTAAEPVCNIPSGLVVTALSV